jgi:tripartite-type tricarboxylate transporter receptor subunit TctC
MRKLFLILFAAFTTASFAGQTVPIVWPFATASNQVNFVRAIIGEANKQQDKYTFVLDFKSGAGGSIAANYVKNYNGIALLTSSSTFFVRPEFYPNESHSTIDFKPVMIQCTGQPFLINSAKYKTIDDIRKQKSVTIGVVLGSLAEAMSRQLKQAIPNVELVTIPYQNSFQSLNDLIAGTIDLNVGLPTETLQFVNIGRVNVIGATGTKDYPAFPTFNKQDIKGFTGLVNNFQIVTKATIDPAIVEELHTILRRAAKNSKTLQEFYAVDYCTGVDFDFAQTNEFYTQQIKYWSAKLKSLK